MTTYGYIEIRDALTFRPSGYIIQPNRATLVSANGTGSVALPPPASPGLWLKSDIGSTVAANPTGLLWSQITQADIDLTGLAGDGLVYANNTINVGESDTIRTTANTTYVNSNTVLGQPLLSAGFGGTPAGYGPLNLAGTDVTTGSLPVVRGGTGVAAFTPNTLLAVDAGGNLTFTGYSPEDIMPTTGTATFADNTPGTVLDIPVTPDNTYVVRCRYSVYERNGAGIIITGVAGFHVEAILTDQGGTWRRVNQFNDVKFAPSATTSDAEIVAALDGGTPVIRFQATGRGVWKVTVDPLHVQPAPVIEPV